MDDTKPGLTIFMLGRARLDGHPFTKSSIEAHELQRDLLNVLRRLNGSFLLGLWDSTQGIVRVATDRAGSWPFFYFTDGLTFTGALHYGSLLRRRRQSSTLRWNPDSVFEFLHLQHLLGDHVLDADLRRLPAASVLQWDRSGAVHVQRYWVPNCRKTTSSITELSTQLGDGLRASYQRMHQSTPDSVLLLSGGLDSRMVLAACTPAPSTVTLGPHRNNEVRVAERVAFQAGAEHSFSLRSPDHYGEIFKQASWLSGGHYVFDHAHFMGLEDSWTASRSIALHGYGLDFMFQGKYLPIHKVRCLGRSTFLKRLKPLSQPWTEMYLQTIPFRLKSIASDQLVKPDWRQRLRESLRHSIDQDVAQSSVYAQEEYDLWEALHMNSLSSHYTYLNILSLRTMIDECTLAFDNEILDLYYSLPAQSRYDGTLFRKTLTYLNPRLAAIRNANTNLRPDRSDVINTAAHWGRQVLRNAGLTPWVLGPPSQNERSWPDRNSLLRNSVVLRDCAVKLRASSIYERLPFLDADRINSMIDQHLASQANHADAILSLLTIDSFIEQAEGSQHQ